MKNSVRCHWNWAVSSDCYHWDAHT